MTLIYTASCPCLSPSPETVGCRIRDNTIVLVKTVWLSFTLLPVSPEKVDCRIRDSTTILVKTSMTVIYTVSCLSVPLSLSVSRERVGCRIQDNTIVLGKTSMTVISHCFLSLSLSRESWLSSPRQHDWSFHTVSCLCLSLERVGCRIRDNTIVLIKTVWLSFTLFPVSPNKVDCRIRDSTTILVKTSMTVIYTVSCPSVSFSLCLCLCLPLSVPVCPCLSL